MKKARPFALYILLALLFFQGISGLAGGAVLMIKPDGSLIHMPLSILKGSLFSSFLVPAVILFAVLGVFPLFTFYTAIALPEWKFLVRLNIYKQMHIAWMCSLFTGFGLIIWTGAEMMIIGSGSLLQAVYAITGLLILVFTLMPPVIKYYSRNEFLKQQGK